jgi:two-component system, NarL family, nitrate/nitrite response regulator NarL
VRPNGDHSSSYDWRMTTAAPITVVVGDDHPMYRDGVVRALKDSGSIRVVAEASDGRAALTAIRDHQPSVALLDYKMPELDGLDVVHAVARDGLATHVLLLSAFNDAALVYKALAAGAAGFLTKDSDRAEIVAAVISCANGAGYVPSSLASGLANELRQRAKGDSALLSPRELETVRMIAEGLSVPQIAAKLHLAPTTVRTHVQNLYRKLGVSDRGAAVAEAMRRRLLE